MNTPIDIELLKSISGNGKVYTAFGYVIAVDRGLLALMPWTLVLGNMTQLIHSCPVPYKEALLSIETQATKAVDCDAEHYSDIVHRLLSISVGRWNRASLNCLHASLFQHDSGLKIVLADELTYRKSQDNALTN